MRAPRLLRGEVWLVDFDPTRGHEQAGTRPALVVSVDLFNQSPAELCIVLPITSRAKNVRSHVRLDPPEGGLNLTSYIKTEDVRSVAHERFIRRVGAVSPLTLREVEVRLRMLLGM